MSILAIGITHRRIVAATSIVMGSVLLSRMLGFFREWVVAHQMGSNAATDAYYAAFTLPDVLNYLIAGGSLSVTFIPVFAHYAAKKSEEEGWRTFSTVVTVMGAVSVALVIIGEVFARKLVFLATPGFNPAERERVVYLTRVMLPAQICFYEGGILSAVQYAKGKFLIPSLAPLVYNVSIILGGLLLSSRIAMTGFAFGVLAGAIAGNFLLQIYGAHRAGARFYPNFEVQSPGFRLFLKLSVPIMLAISLGVADDWIIRWFGSYLEPASITWLTYGKNLMRVPIDIVGQGIGVASFPILAQLYSERKFDELNGILNSTLKGIILFLVPISTLTMAQSLPLVHLIFAHTRLRGPDLQATAGALAFFSIGMFAWGAAYILARGFYAASDTITPAVVGTMMTLLTLPLYWLLARRFQYRGLALASSLGIVVYALVLFFLLNRRTKNREETRIVIFFSKVMAASAVSGFGCYEVAEWLGTRSALQRPLGSFVLLAIASSVGIVLLGISLKILRVREVGSYLEQAISFAARTFRRAPAGA